MFETPLAIGVDFGGTSVKFGVLYRSNIIDQAPAISTPDFDGPDELIEAMLRVIGELRDRHPRIEAIGVGVPGFVHFEKGIVHNLTNVPCESGFRYPSLVAMLNRREMMWRSTVIIYFVYTAM